MDSQPNKKNKLKCVEINLASLTTELITYENKKNRKCYSKPNCWSDQYEPSCRQDTCPAICP